MAPKLGGEENRSRVIASQEYIASDSNLQFRPSLTLVDEMYD